MRNVTSKTGNLCLPSVDASMESTLSIEGPQSSRVTTSEFSPSSWSLLTKWLTVSAPPAINMPAPRYFAPVSRSVLIPLRQLPLQEGSLNLFGNLGSENLILELVLSAFGKVSQLLLDEGCLTNRVELLGDRTKL